MYISKVKVSSFLSIKLLAVSRLKINLSKLEIILVGEVVDVDSLANIFGCSVARLLMKYLGLPLGASYKSTSIAHLIKKIAASI